MFPVTPVNILFNAIRLPKNYTNSRIYFYFVKRKNGKIQKNI